MIVTTSHTSTSESTVGWYDQTELPFDALVETVFVGVVQTDVERVQPAQHRQTDPACGDRPDRHALEIVGALDAVRDVPAALHDPLVRRDVVANQRQDHHHHVFRHADAVGVGDLGDGDAAVDGRLQVDVIGSDARR